MGIDPQDLPFYANDKLPHPERKGHIMMEQTIARTDTAVAPVLLTPSLVEKMLASRQAVQVIKFRTTCTDCLPNY
jgi:hypothetical protein